MNRHALLFGPHQVFLGSVFSEKHVFEVCFEQKRFVGAQTLDKTVVGRAKQHQPRSVKECSWATFHGWSAWESKLWTPCAVLARAQGWTRKKRWLSPLVVASLNKTKTTQLVSCSFHYPVRARSRVSSEANVYKQKPRKYFFSKIFVFSENKVSANSVTPVHFGWKR